MKKKSNKGVLNKAGNVPNLVKGGDYPHPPFGKILFPFFLFECFRYCKMGIPPLW